jgi:hypothetical protein
MVNGVTIESALSLGRKLIENLDERDVLGGWMCHYLAERFVLVEQKKGVERELIETEIAALVLELWAHRAGAPLRDSPTVQLDHIRGALSRIDPKLNAWGYHVQYHGNEAPSSEDLEVNAALSLAVDVDRATRRLIRSLYSYATANAVAKDSKWILAARNAGVDPLSDLTDLLDGEVLEDGLEFTVIPVTLEARASELIELLEKIKGDNSV